MVRSCRPCALICIERSPVSFRCGYRNAAATIRLHVCARRCRSLVGLVRTMNRHWDVTEHVRIHNIPAAWHLAVIRGVVIMSNLRTFEMAGDARTRPLASGLLPHLVLFRHLSALHLGPGPLGAGGSGVGSVGRRDPYQTAVFAPTSAQSTHPAPERGAYANVVGGSRSWDCGSVWWIRPSPGNSRNCRWACGP